MQSPLIEQMHFTSAHTLKENGKTMQSLGLEIDLHHFLRTTVENPIIDVIGALHNDRTLKRKFSFLGTVTFKNHANTLSPEGGNNPPGIFPARRRSPRLLEREGSYDIGELILRPAIHAHVLIRSVSTTQAIIQQSLHISVSSNRRISCL